VEGASVPPASAIVTPTARESPAPKQADAGHAAAKQGEEETEESAVTAPPAQTEVPPPTPPPPQTAEGDANTGAVASGATRAPIDSSFAITSESVAYNRFLQVEHRTVRYPNGKEYSFDIVGHPKSTYRFVVVFAYHSATECVTVLREFAQAAPPHAATTLVLPTGGYDASRHSSLLAAAQAELAEEARLAGGTWHALLPDEHPGILESKWCRNRFTPFLCIDPQPNGGQGERDAEEFFESCVQMPLPEARTALAQGDFLPPSMQTCFSAMEWLANRP